MEQQQWPTKYQQSVATDELILDCTTAPTPDDCLNNGNGENTKSADNNNETDEKIGNDDNDNNIIINNNNNSSSNSKLKQTNTGNQPVQTTTISDKAKQILEHMSSLSNTEKYLLYLKFFQLTNVVDPLRQPLNPLGSRIEISRTISWIKTHLVEDPEVSLPKQQVYDEYSNYCLENKIKSLSQADFGKVMKQVYPKVRARRLGTRGNSRYCYSGLRRCIKLNAPILPDLSDKPLSTEAPCTQSSLTAAAWLIIKEWSEQHFGTTFSSLQALAYYLVITYSVGVGTEAANQVTSATNAQSKDTFGGKSGIKHREMQLQLQKKIQQKNEVKERKRKMQSPKCEQKLNGKRAKQQNSIQSTRPETSPTLTGTGESSTSTSTTSTGTGSTCTSPTQGKPICDKSLDFTQLPALPDFKSFQKPVVGDINTSPNNIINNNNNNIAITNNNNNNNNNNSSSNNNNNNNNNNSNSNSASGGAAKVPIPRLSVPKIHRSPQTSPRKQIKNAKYKAIQPKPQPCDIASYNPQPNAVDLRSQDVHNVDRFKERIKCSDEDDEDDCDAPDFPLTRERLDSVSNVDKDAMDEYLGTSNSQHEEELSKYFNNNVDQDNSDKLSQLRHLLEQNVSDNKNVLLNVIDPNSTIIQDDVTTLNNTPINQIPVQNVIPYVAPIQTNLTTISDNNQALVVAAALAAAATATPAPATPVTTITATTTSSISTTTAATNQSRRRVSFETLQQDDTVPPSPNTRRKNFSFTPISPGPQSPTGRQSKCSSTNVSPFVSPRNTPIPRVKNCGTSSTTTATAAAATTTPTLNCNNNKKMNMIKIKREPDLVVEIPPNSDGINNFPRQHCMPQSAPTSPMLNTNKSVLQKLLNSNSKVTYTPDYINPTIKTDTTELCEMFKTETDDLTTQFNYHRSQSVPIINHNISKNEFNNQFIVNNNTTVETTTNGNNSSITVTTGADFNDLDPISETSATVGRIIEALDEPCDTNNIEMFVDINTKNQILPTFNLFINNNTTDLQNNFAQDNTTVEGVTTTTTATTPPTVVTFNNNQTPCSRILNRSQSIDVNGCYEIKTNPSRSVPTTPLPFQNIKPQTQIKSFTHSSRSYPSTPLLINETPFTYNLNGDCLLNGQPIRSNNHLNGGGVGSSSSGVGGGGGSSGNTTTATSISTTTSATGDQDLDNNLRYFIPNLNEINDDNNIETHLTQDEFSIDRSLPSNEYGIVENENVLMDDGGVLIADQTYNGNIN